MTGTDDTTKPFFCGDEKSFVFKPIKSIEGFRVVGSDVDVTMRKGEYVEVVFAAGRLVATRRPVVTPPSYEDVYNAMVPGDTFDDQVVAVMKLFGVKDPKPTVKPEDETYEQYSGV